MKMFYQLAVALLCCTGLVACGANSIFEADALDPDPNMQSKVSSQRAIPEGCVSWFDGCNTCTVRDGEKGACTRMACKSQVAQPSCRAFAPEVADTGAPMGQEDAPVPDTIPEIQRAVSAEVPENCKIWFDGCNSCVVMRGKLRGCTSKSCSVLSEAKCINGN